MLPRAHRLRRPQEFRGAVRSGARAGSRTLVAHLLAPEPATARTHPSPEPTRIGIITSKAVGPAVVRNRVKRRLRHLVRARLDLLPAGSQLVVRALPAAASASTRELATDLDAVLARTTGVRA